MRGRAARDIFVACLERPTRLMRKTKTALLFLVSTAVVLSLASCSKQNSDAPATSQQSMQSAPARPAPNPLKNAYFGDLHLHTGYSMDAFAFGTRTTPEDSYKYAMGETVEYMGKPQKRIAPLDFLAVTDHAEYLGVVRDTIDPNGPFANSEWYKTMTNPDPAVSATAFRKLIGSTVVNKPLPEFNDPKLLRSAWEKYAAISDKYYKPGKFTTFVGFEWTSAPQFQNLHRCVIFADKGPAMPYTAFDSLDPEDLWRYLEAQRKQGLDVIAVPHNGNASNGLMFSTRDMSGKPITRDYAERRMANEPLAEIIQAKGQTDTSPALSPTDEFANFEMWLYLIGSDKKANSATGSYLRQAYGVGQEQQAKLGVNPVQVRHRGRHRLPLRHNLDRTQQLSGLARQSGQRSQDRDYRYDLRRWRASHGSQFRRTDRRLGRREHPRIHLRRLQAQRDLWHLRSAHQGSHVCRLELSQGHDQAGRLGQGRLRRRRAHGRRSGPQGWQPPLRPSSFTPSRIPTAEISTASRSSRSRPRTARARRRLRRGVERRPQARSENRQGPGRRQYG